MRVPFAVLGAALLATACYTPTSIAELGPDQRFAVATLEFES